MEIEDLSLKSKIKLLKTRNLGNELLIENDYKFEGLVISQGRVSLSFSFGNSSFAYMRIVKIE